eukprot:2443985-Pyramimonas_sp.AAC.1
MGATLKRMRELARGRRPAGSAQCPAGPRGGAAGQGPPHDRGRERYDDRAAEHRASDRDRRQQEEGGLGKGAGCRGRSGGQTHGSPVQRRRPEEEG